MIQAVFLCALPAATPAPRPASAAASETVRRLVVLNKSDSTLMAIDPDSGEVDCTVPTGSGPHEVAVSPDGRTAVVSDYGAQTPGSTLTVVDLEQGQVRLRIGLGDHRRPHGIAYLADGRRVAVTSEESRALLVVEVESGKVLEALDTGQDVSHMVALSPDQTRAFVANIGSGSVSVLDLVSGKLVGHIPTGAGAEAIDVTPDGGEVWVGNRAADTLTVLDTRTLERRAEIPCAEFPIRLKLTPDGQHVLVSAMRSAELVVLDAKSGKEERRIPMRAPEVADKAGRLFAQADGPLPIGILIEPSGRRAFVANTNADTVTVVDLSSWKVSGTLATGHEPDGMAWSERESAD